jgi:hypothetical protein
MCRRHQGNHHLIEGRNKDSFETAKKSKKRRQKGQPIIRRKGHAHRKIPE